MEQWPVRGDFCSRVQLGGKLAVPGEKRRESPVYCRDRDRCLDRDDQQRCKQPVMGERTVRCLMGLSRRAVCRTRVVVPASEGDCVLLVEAAYRSVERSGCWPCCFSVSTSSVARSRGLLGLQPSASRWIAAEKQDVAIATSVRLSARG